MPSKRNSGPSSERLDPDVAVRNSTRTISQCDKRVRIAFIGFPGHGKSSLQNTVASFSCNPPRLKQLARAGHGDNNITKQFTDHELVVWDPSASENRVSKIILVDTPGQCCKELMLDDKKNEHSLNRAQAQREAILETVIGPLHQAHTTCLVIVVSAHQVWQDAKRYMGKLQLMRGGSLQLPHESATHERLQTLRQIQNIGGDQGMRSMCILTHADEADKAIRKDAAKVYDSCTIDRIKDYVARQLGMTPNLVHAVVNLRHEPDPAANMELGRIALETFCHAVQFAVDGYNEQATGSNSHLQKQPGEAEMTMRCTSRNIPSAY